MEERRKRKVIDSETLRPIMKVAEISAKERIPSGSKGIFKGVAGESLRPLGLSRSELDSSRRPVSASESKQSKQRT